MSAIARGAPLVNPTGIALSTDGRRILVADPGAGNGGAIFSLPATTTEAKPIPIPGTAGREPRGIDVLKQEDGVDVIYFTGIDPADGAVGLFKVPATGGTVETVAEGSPFIAPDSVVVASGGAAYVSDQGSGHGLGEVFRVDAGRVVPVLTDLDLGTPGGLTLVEHDSVLLVSSVDKANQSDQVLFLDLATSQTAVATKVIGANKDSSGGLHAAQNAPVLAWADIQGSVYRVRFP